MTIKIFVFNPVQENTYLLYDETREAVIIDCGVSNPAEQKRLKDFIQEHGLTVKYLLNTHLHFDHTLGNRFIFEEYGLKPRYDQPEESMPGLKTQVRSMGFSGDYEPIEGDEYIKDGDVIRFGNSSLKAISTPGHSPASLSYYSESDACVFTGDALFYRSIGRTDLWGGNYSQLIRSIKEKLLSLPDNTVVYPGHGPASTVLDERNENPYLND